MILDGFLVESPADRLRLLVYRACIELDRTAVVDVEERGLPYIGADGRPRAIPVRLRIADGAPLRGLGSADPFSEAIGWAHAPFLVAARLANPLPLPSAVSYAEKEWSFLRAHGLVDDV